MGMDINAILEADRFGDGKLWRNLGEIPIDRGSNAFNRLREFSYNHIRFTREKPLYWGFAVNQPASVAFQFDNFLGVGFDFTYVTLAELSELDHNLYTKCWKIAVAHGYYGGDCRLCFYFNH